MHHSQKFADYTAQKKIQLIALLILKVAIVIVGLVGLKIFLGNYTASPLILFGVPHLILLAIVIGYFFLHRQKAHGNHDHDAQCNCEQKHG